MKRLIGKEIDPHLKNLSEGWTLVEEHHLCKEFQFKDFKEALSFVNAVGSAAEQQNHHPCIELNYNKVVIELFTHKVEGLSEKDFVLAKMCDAAAKR